jgi:4-amino-4-deoxy-L-arabinose transferase-like glycosyltransferase
MGRVPKAAWAILAVALLLRVGAAEAITQQLSAGADERAYVTIATSIADGEGFPDEPAVLGGGPSALSPPGYPYLLGGVFLATGDSTTAARAVQALLGTVTVALIGLIAWQIFRRRDVALAAMAMGAVYPPLIVIAAPLMTESLLLPLMLGAVAAALRQRERGGLGWAAAVGALGGLAALTKDIGVIALLVVTFAIWAKPRLTASSLRAPAVALAVAAAIGLPWTIRNAIEFDSLVPVSNKLGIALAGSYNESAREDPEHVWLPPAQLPELNQVFVDPELDEAETARELESRALDVAADHPGYPLALAYQNTRRLLQLDNTALTAFDAEWLGFGGGSAATTTFEAIWWSGAVAFLLLAVLAVLAAIRGDIRAVPKFILVLALLVVVPLLVIAAGPRFRLPVDVLLIVVAAPAAVRLARTIRRRVRVTRRSSSAPARLPRTARDPTA